MTLLVLLVFVLYACRWSTDGCIGSSTRSSSYSRGDPYYSTGLVVNRGRVGVSGEYGRRDDWSVRGTVYRNGVEVGVTKNFRKRSATWNGNHYNVTLQVDPCNFKTYDDNRDGVIIKDEFNAIFGETEQMESLFADLDSDTADGAIKRDEFYAMAPLYINACVGTDE